MVILRQDDGYIYIQGNIKLYADEHEVENFKASWPFNIYLEDGFFPLMVDQRGVERIFFLDQQLKDEVEQMPELIDYAGLFSLVQKKTPG